MSGKDFWQLTSEILAGQTNELSSTPLPTNSDYTYTDSGRGNYSHAHSEYEKRKNPDATPKASYLEQQYEEYTERGRGHESYARSNYLAEAVNDAQTKGRGTQSHARTSYLEDAINNGNPVEQTTETAMHDQMAKNADVSKVQGEIDEYRELMKTADDAAVFSRKASNNQYEDAQGVIAKANADAEEARAKAQEIAERLERNYGITVNGTRVDASGFYNSYFAKEMEAAKKAASEKPVDTIAMLLGQDAEYMDASTTDMLRSASEDEKQLYRYLLEQDKANGTKIADIYRTYLEDTQARERGAEIAKNIEAKDEGVGKALSYGARAVASGASNALNAVRDTITGEQGARGVNEYAAGELRQGLADEGRNTAAFFFDAAQSVGAMTPGLVAGFANPALGAAVFATTTGASSYQDKLDEGWAQSDAAAYGVLTAIAEGGLQYVTGGVGKLAMKNNLVKAVVDKVTNTAGKPLLHAIANAAGRAGGEAIEEIAQTYIEPAIVSVLAGTPYDTPETRDALRAGLLGAVTSLGLGGGEFIGDIREANVQAAKNANNAPEAVGNEMTPPTAQETAQTASGEFNSQTEPKEADAMLLEIANRGRVNNSTAAQIAKSPELSEAFSRMYSAELGGVPLSGTMNQRQTAIQNAVRQRANAEAKAQTAVDESTNALAEYSAAEAARENTLEQAAADMTEREAANNNYASYIRGVIQNGATAKEAKTILDTPELRALWETMTGVTLPASRNKATNAIMSSRRNVGIDALLETAKVVPAQPEVALEAPLSPQNTPKNIAEIAPESVEYTIERDNAGDVTIHINKAMLDNVPRENWEKVVRGKIQAIFKNGITLPRGTIYSNKKGRGEFSNGSYTRMLERTEPDLYRAKMNMASGTGAMVENAKNVKSEPPAHDRADDIVAFNRGNIRVVVDRKSYTGDVLTAIYKDGKEVFFDVNNIAKEKTEATPERYAAVGGFSQTGAAPASKGFPLNVSINATAPAVNTSMQSKPVDDAVRERGFSENVATDTAMEQTIREEFESDPEYYQQRRNVDTLEKANELFRQGLEKAKQSVRDALAESRAGKKFPPEMVPLSRMVANQLAKNGNIRGARDILAGVAAELTEAGQLGQAARILRNADTATKVETITKLVEKLNETLTKGQRDKNIKAGIGTSKGGIVVNNTLLNNYANAASPEAQNEALKAIEKEIAKQIPATFVDQFNALRYLNMLGNMKTQVRNVGGNAIMAVTAATKRRVAGGIEGLVSAVTNNGTDRTSVFWAGGQLFKEASKDFDAFESEAMGEGKYSDTNAQISRNINDERTIFNNKLLEGYRKLTNKAMSVGDQIFLRFTYADAMSGWLKAHGINSVSEASPEQLASAREFAIKEAQEATFRDSNTVSDYVSKIGRGKNTPEAVRIISEGLVPFRKTPANVAVRAVEYSPLGIANTIIKAVQAKNGKADATDVINSIAKTATGTALFAAGIAASMAGKAKGSEDDEELAAFEKLRGESDYSIKIGDKWVSLSQFAPMAIPFFIGVRLNEVLEEQGLNTEAISKILTAVSEPMLEMSMLGGINDALGTLSDYGSGDGNELWILFGNAVISYLTQGLSNQFLGQLESIGDKTRQTTYTDKDSFLGSNAQYKLGQFANKIPGWDYQQQDYVDAWGRTQDNGSWAARAANALVNPTYSSKDRSTEVDAELERLYADNKDVEDFPNVLPEKRSRSATYGDGKVMTADEYLQFSKDSGQMKLELVSEFIKSDEYKQLNDEQRAAIINNLYSFADDRALQKVKDANGVTKKSDFERLLTGVDKPGDANDIPALKEENALEYITFNSLYNNMVKDADYSGIDALLSQYDGFDPNTKDVISNKSFTNLSDLLKFKEAGSNAETYYTIKEAVGEKQWEMDKNSATGSHVKMAGLAKADIPDEEKDTLVASEAFSLSKTAKKTYEIMRDAGFSPEVASAFFEYADMTQSAGKEAKTDGSLSAYEVATAISKLPIDERAKTQLYGEFKSAIQNPDDLYDTWGTKSYQKALRTSTNYGRVVGNADGLDALLAAAKIN